MWSGRSSSIFQRDVLPPASVLKSKPTMPPSRSKKHAEQALKEKLGSDTSLERGPKRTNRSKGKYNYCWPHSGFPCMAHSARCSLLAGFLLDLLFDCEDKRHMMSARLLPHFTASHP
jgi:hypothetical protein